MDLVNMREMLEAGFHFGHQTTRWDPRMKPYIFSEKNGIYIIDLQKSLEMAKLAFQKIREVAGEDQDVLLVGTKKQAQTIVQGIAEEAGMHYVDQRWIGGLLTNFELVRKSIDRLMELEEMKNDGRWEIKSKKEQSKLEKVYKKLKKSLWGVRNLKGLPALVLVIDTNFEEIAVKEANKLNIPIVAIVDTNSNPSNIDFPIPGNDDAIRSIKLFIKKFSEAFQAGREDALARSMERGEEPGGETGPEENASVAAQTGDESPAAPSEAVKSKAEAEAVAVKAAARETAAVEQPASPKEAKSGDAPEKTTEEPAEKAAGTPESETREPEAKETAAKAPTTAKKTKETKAAPKTAVKETKTEKPPAKKTAAKKEKAEKPAAKSKTAVSKKTAKTVKSAETKDTKPARKTPAKPKAKTDESEAKAGPEDKEKSKEK